MQRSTRELIAHFRSN